MSSHLQRGASSSTSLTSELGGARLTHVSKTAIICCARFSFHESYDAFLPDEQADAQKWFFEWGKTYLIAHKLTSLADDEIAPVLMQQFGDFNLRRGCFSTIDTEHNVLKKHHEKKMEQLEERKRRRYDARQTWSISIANELSILVIALLSITASEAAVERSFSRQGLIHSKLRNRLSDDNVEMSMFFAFNTRALEHKERPNGASWKELKADDMKEATELLSSYRPRFDEEVLSDSDDDEEYTGEPMDEEDGDEEDEQQEVDEDEQEDAEWELEQARVESKEREYERREREYEEQHSGEEVVEKQRNRAVRAAGREVNKMAASPVETAEEKIIEEKEELEESAAQRKKREKKERVETLAAFVAKYVEDHSIENGYQWSGPRRQQLTGALIAAGVGDTEDTTVAAIRKYLKSRLPPTAPPVAADNDATSASLCRTRHD
jgi:hypothetical protein